MKQLFNEHTQTVKVLLWSDVAKETKFEYAVVEVILELVHDIRLLQHIQDSELVHDVRLLQHIQDSEILYDVCLL